MIWRGSTLYDDHRSIAQSTPDTIRVPGDTGATVLRITADNPVRFRAFDVGAGGEYELRKAGLTVSRYVASCAGRRYTCNRTGFDFLAGAITPKREIRDASGELIASPAGSRQASSA